jgi:hypothetical protein
VANEFGDWSRTPPEFDRTVQRPVLAAADDDGDEEEEDVV